MSTIKDSADFDGSFGHFLNSQNRENKTNKTKKKSFAGLFYSDYFILFTSFSRPVFFSSFRAYTTTTTHSEKSLISTCVYTSIYGIDLWTRSDLAD